ncbi:hypothetical protein PUN28_017624 [Cardiocondyla obscurior]|uniref:Uncharacterized protein n=1 Tax=Cardiocondyla obscurior TaxID=286306 RepID=A0AAW2EKJ8_9HYME
MLPFDLLSRRFLRRLSACYLQFIYSFAIRRRPRWRKIGGASPVVVCPAVEFLFLFPARSNRGFVHVPAYATRGGGEEKGEEELDQLPCQWHLSLSLPPSLSPSLPVTSVIAFTAELKYNVLVDPYPRIY